MLTLIGLGLFDEMDLTLRGIEKARKSDKVYIELYTSRWYGDIEKIEKLIGKEIIELKRRNLEEESGKILQEAKTQKISILIQGDPLVQTTHQSLLEEANKMGIETKVVHNASIMSAVGETGLHSSKFGRYVTIPFPEKTKGELPESVFEIIRENQERKLHTLCLLDVVAEENRYMTVNQGISVLLEGGILTDTSKILILAKAGSEKPLIVWDTVNNVARRNMEEVPAAIVVPGELHYTEKDFLDLYSPE